MSANDKVAATFHGAEPCSARSTVPGTTITTEGVQTGRILICELGTEAHHTHSNDGWNWSTGEWLAHEGMTPEQDLRAAVAERVTDATHFNGCPGGDACRCLISRLNWAINAEEVTS